MSSPTAVRSHVKQPAPQWGAQQPQRLLLPPAADRYRTAGPEVGELAASAGLFLDPWQQFCLDAALWERPSDDIPDAWEWSAFEVALLVSRQNGKGSILEARELAGLFLFEESLILHSAHEFKTSGEAFRRINGLIENTAWMSKRVASVSTAHGAEGIELLPRRRIISGPGGRQITGGRRCRLRFVARTGGSGRGFTADLVIWDEAFNLPETVVGAQLPTLSAVDNPQLWYTSSAVDKDVHTHGVTLARVRKRALDAIASGDAPPPVLVPGETEDDDDDEHNGLVWMEWQADEAAYLAALEKSERAAKEFAARPEQWALANPGQGFRLRPKKIRKELRAMGAKTFRVERLGIGDWPPVDEDQGRIDMDRWDAIGDDDSRPEAGQPIALAVEVSQDGRTAAISSAGRRADGRFHVKVTDHRPGGGTGWVVPRLMDLVGRYKTCVVLLNPAGQAGALAADLRAAGLHDWSKTRPGKGGLRELSAREYAQACGELVADATNTEADRLRHCAQANLDDAVREAGTRKLAEAWAWDHNSSTADITTLVAVTLALHGFRVHGSEKGVVPWGEFV